MEIEIVVRLKDCELVLNEKDAQELYKVLDRFYGPARYFNNPQAGDIYGRNSAGT